VRLVCSDPALSHATPLLRRLHWLPVARRITYKLCVLMFDVFHGTAPTYLTDICSRCSDNGLRSTARGKFVVRRTRTRFADSFVVAGPAAWNSLPVNMRNIQRSADNLKVTCSLFLTKMLYNADYDHGLFHVFYAFLNCSLCHRLRIRIL